MVSESRGRSGIAVVVSIRIDGKRIIADIPYAGGLGPKQAKQVPGARDKWNKKVEPNKFLGWTYPLNLDSCYALRRVFGQELVIDDGLAGWAREEIRRQRELETLREEEIQGYTLDLLAEEAPQLYLAMMSRSYQPAGTAFMVTAGKSILGDEPGLGKTLQTIGAIIESDAHRILVACTKSAISSVWERETRRWTKTIATYVAQDTHADRERVMERFQSDVRKDLTAGWPHPRRMLIINADMIKMKRQKVCPEGLDPTYCNSRPAEARGDHRHTYKSYPRWPFLFQQTWDAIILDESHKVLASTANRQSKRITQGRLGAVQLRRRLRDGGLAAALSGTAFLSDLTKGWGTLNWLWPDKFGSYWQWAETYFGVTEQQAGSRRVKIVGGGAKAPEPIDQEAFNKMLRPYYLARKKAEVAADLPPIIYAGTPPEDNPDGPCYVRLDMDSKQARAYKQMVNDAEADIRGGRITATGVLAEITRRRQFATSYARLGPGRKVIPELPSNKIEWIADFMRERERTDAKVIIASNFTEIVEMTAGALRKNGWEVLTLTGATNTRNRALLQNRFQNPEDSLRVVVLNTKAGGESITLDAADEMIVIDDPWKSDTSKQLHDRIHRVSRIHQVTIYRLLSKDTIEEWIADLTDEQRRVLEAASPRKLSEMMRDAQVRKTL